MTSRQRDFTSHFSVLPGLILCTLAMAAIGARAAQTNPATVSPPEEKARSSAAGASSAMLGAVLEGDVVLIHEGKPVPGIEVVEVKAGGPSARAGVRQGDLIVRILGVAVRSSAELEDVLGRLSPGMEVPVEIFRDGKKVAVTVALGSAPKNAGAKPAAPAQPAKHSATGKSLSAAMAKSAVPTPASPAAAATGLFVNNRELTPAQVEQIRQIYGFVAPPGRYWYDAKSGLWGVIGREAAGFLRPGHDFGPLPPNPSNGNTGVFINGREINMVEAMYCQQLFGAVYRGRWWLDGTTGYLGMEGNPAPVANVFLALQQAARSGQGSGGYSWHSNATGASGGSDGKCSYVSIPGSGSVMTGNCD